MKNRATPVSFVDLEIRIFEHQDEGYPVEITLGGQQEFPRGYLAADVLPWVSSGDPVADGQRLFDAHESADSVVLYLHGGAFMYGSERSHGELCARVALAARARLAFASYRLAPEHRFPAALDDAVAVYRSLLEGGVPASQVVVAGDSAGGNLALALLVALRNRKQQLPAGAVLISPCVDLTATGGSLERHEPYDWASPWMFERWATEYVGDADAADPLASPALADLHGLPPLLIPIGTKEMLYDQVLALADKARAAGVEVTLDPEPDRVHLWLALAEMFPEFQATFDRIGQFVRESTAAPESGRSG